MFSTPIRQFQGWLAGWLALQTCWKTATHFLKPTMELRSTHRADDQLGSSSGCASRADLAEEERQFAKYHGTPVAGLSLHTGPKHAYVPSWLSLSREAGGIQF